jgi:radical SAM protein with 4Fe4S-binding SPASM domain
MAMLSQLNSRYFLSKDIVLRRLEEPSVYNAKKDDLYEVDEMGFSFLRKCADVRGCSTDDIDFLSYCLAEGIISDSPKHQERQFIRRSPVPSLRYLELLITDRCNLKCRHCYIGDPEVRELPIDVLKILLEEFYRLQGLRVLISGGEPLLHQDFDLLNEYLVHFPLRRVLLTNGTLLTEKRLESLNVDEIQISIDGLEVSHDSMRGKGSFRKAMEGFQKARRHGFDVSVSTMVHPENLNDFDEMEELFRALGSKEWTVDVPCLSGRMEGNRDLLLTPEVAGRYLRYGYGGGFHGGGEGFACGLHLLSVLPDGYVAKCAFYADRPVGRISEGLETCWTRIKPIDLVSLSCDCNDIDVCRGGCRYRAELSGDSMGKDLFKCCSFKGE